MSSFYFAYRFGSGSFEHCLVKEATDLSDAISRVSDFDFRELAAADVLIPKPLKPGCLCRAGKKVSKHHILVGSTCSRAEVKHVARHRWNGPVPSGSFWKLSDAIYVSTPEFTFLQLGSLLTPIELALVGCALLSPYYLDEHLVPRVRQPLTTIEKIRGFLARCPHAYGSKKVRQILPYLCDTATNPLDLNLWAHFCFPVRLGGMGLPPAQTNALIIPRKTSAHKRPRTRPFKANLYWRRQHAAVKVVEELGKSDAREQLLSLLADGLNLISISLRYLTGNESLMNVSPGFFDQFRKSDQRLCESFQSKQQELLMCLTGPARFVL